MSSDQIKPVISVKNLTKSFKIPLDKGRGVKDHVLGRATQGYREFTPLDDISFTVNEGDFFGIVGRNGSGKSTLLRTIAGVYQPTAGKIKVNGRLIPFIELGVGFNHQLTGRENVYLNAALLGFSRQEVDEMYEDIVDFAELHDFMEERLQNYSSGMQVRLAFSISIRAKGDILLLDEVLAVGDTAFQQKCYNYFKQLKKEKKTVVLVTHSMDNVEEFCNRGLLLNEGKIECIGSSKEVADAYRSMFNVQSMGEALGKGFEKQDQEKHQVIDIEDIEIRQENKRKSELNKDKKFEVIARVRLKDSSYSDFNISIEVRNTQDLLMFSTSYSSINLEYINFIEDKQAVVGFEIDNILGNGSYYVNVKARASKDGNDDQRTDILAITDCARFNVYGHKYDTYSLVYPRISTHGTNITKKPIEF